MHVRKTFPIVEVKAVEGSDRELIVRISSISQDRSSDVVLPQGIVLDNYLKNNVVAAFHRYDRPAIGNAFDITPSEKDIIARVVFAPKGINPEADMLCELYKQGVQKGWSIGFKAIEWTQNDSGGYIFSKWELLEFSAVLVPDNQDALTLAKTKGIDVSPIEKVIASETIKTLSFDSETKQIKLTMTDDSIKEFPATDDIFAYFKEVFDAQIQLKEGRVLSEKNRSLISTCIKALQDSSKALDELLTATEPKHATPEEKKTADGVEQLRSLVNTAKKLDKEVGLFLGSIKLK